MPRKWWRICGNWWKDNGGVQSLIHVGPAASVSKHRTYSAKWFIRTVRFWIECACFFVIATPFELEIGSGYGYTIKALAGAVLLVPRVVAGRVSMDRGLVWIAVLATLFLVANIHNPSIRALLAFFLILHGAALGLLKSEEWNRRLLSMVTVYIQVHLAGFTFALIAFFVLGNVVDLHNVAFPGASRAHEIGAAARLSGFHNEPGTYAQWMLMAVFLRCLLTRRIACPLTVVSGASAIMTFSLWAVAGTGLLLLAIALEVLLRFKGVGKIRFLISALLLSQAVMIAVSYLPSDVLDDGLAYLQLKLEMESDSGLEKLLAMTELKEKLPELVVLGGPVEPGFCPHCLSPQDLGIWATHVYYFGLISSTLLFVFFLLAIYQGWGVHYLPFLIAMLTWKAVFYDLLLWTIIGFVLARSVPFGRHRRHEISR
jgi:hypothetical protein